MKNFVLILMIASYMVSCDSKDPSTTSGTAQEINLLVLPKVNGIEAKVNQYYHLKNGDSILFSRLDFYMQGLSFKDKTGKTAMLDTVFLYSDKNPTNKLIFKSSALPTSIDSVGYLCGLDNMKNSLDPNNFPEQHPLSSWKNMYWTMGTKYRFVVMEGEIKTANGDIILYSYHTGLDYKYKASIPVSITLNVSNPKTYGLHLNLEKVFYPTNGMPILYKNDETQAHGHGNDGPLTDKVALNFSRAFSLE